MNEGLFDIELDWATHWQDMPEFIQEDKESKANVVVHFETLEDMQDFSNLIGITITPETKGIFYPANQRTTRVWVDEP